jgi:formylglycine-generating enzyme required for sulfatase activity
MINPDVFANAARIAGMLAGIAAIIATAVAAVPPDDSVLVAGGTFRMGTAAAAVPELQRRYGIDYPGAFDGEAPAHAVTLSAFRIDRHEVTNARFAEFTSKHPEWSKSGLDPQMHNGHYLEHWTDGQPPPAKLDHPVVFVTWHAAQAFCRAAGGRLPTEAEWEYAARSRGDDEFPWGSVLPSADKANYGESGLRGTAPVGSYAPNRLGLYDVAGNVWEFLLDEWQPAYSERAQTNPMAGGVVGDDQLRRITGRRVLRGGSYDGGVVNLRTRWRDSHVVTNAQEFIGFRCAYKAG